VHNFRASLTSQHLGVGKMQKSQNGPSGWNTRFLNKFFKYSFGDSRTMTKNNKWFFSTIYQFGSFFYPLSIFGTAT
jgi:hypothetical protein